MQLMSAHPNLRPSMVHRTSGDVLKAISSRELDIGFYIGWPDPRIFHATSVTELRYLVLAPAGWQSRVQGRDWKGLAELPWIWTPRETAHHRLLSAIFDEVRASPVKAIEVDQEAEMLELLRSGMGLALVRENVAKVEARLYGLVIAGGLSATAELTLVALKERISEPAIAAAYLASHAVWETFTA